MRIPHLIAICGVPKAGKSAVQKVLSDRYAINPIDDGHPMRAFAVAHMGLTWDDVRTQNGKLGKTIVVDQEWENRKILGELGNALEDKFGKWILPFLATRNLDPSQCYSFGSCRRDQGRFYQQLGGVVVHVRNSYAKETGNEFDTFDKSIVDWTLINDVAPGEAGDPRLMARLQDSVDDMIEHLRVMPRRNAA